MRSQGHDISVLFVPFGSSMTAAARYRVYQYLPYLSGQRIRYRVYSSISEAMTVRMIRSSGFTKIKKYIYFLHLTLERILRFWPILFLASRYDIVFLQRTTFPLGLNKLLRRVNKNIIFDIDDSIYMPDHEENGAVACLKKYAKMREVVSILCSSRCVLVENSHIKNFAAKYCNKIFTIAGPIDTIKNYPKKYSSESGVVVIGWIGSLSTAVYLDSMGGIFRRLRKAHEFRVKLIGVESYKIEGIEVETVPWSEQTEVAQLHTFDIGIMPMPDTEWTRGKVGCKMLQYMANGIPAVVSYTSTNAEIIDHGKNGFIVKTEKEWIDVLSLLIKDPQLRKSVGLAGRRLAEERFALNINAPKVLNILKSVKAI